MGNLGVGGKVEQLEGFNFVAYGDTRSHALPAAVSPVHEELVAMYLQENPEFVVHTGDMVIRGGVWDQWIEFNSSIQEVWAAGIPFYGVVGNHEKYTETWYVNDEDFSNYTTFFDFNSVVDEPGETELMYAFTYADFHFIFLNTEDYFDDTLGGTQQFNCSNEQMSWLTSYLTDIDPEEFVVVTYHRTSWSIRWDRPDRWEEAQTVREAFHELFIQYDVDLVFMGHDHYYYRTLRNGIYYVTTGGGGAPLAEINVTAPIWQAEDVAYSEYHYCNIDVNATHVTVTAVASDHSLLDSFTIERAVIVPPPFPIEPLIIGLGLIVLIAVIIVIIYWRKKK
ncbi:MAG: metallophosphoesterase family protein [Promethearchaeota archaeon]